jgi:hypothetical protein
MTRPYPHTPRLKYSEGSCFESPQGHRPSRPEVLCGVSPILKESSGITSQFSHIHFFTNSIQPQLLPSKFHSATTASFQTRFNHIRFLPNSIQLHALPSTFNSTTCPSFQIQFSHTRLLLNSFKFLSPQSPSHSTLLSSR